MYSVAICDDDINCANAVCKILESEFINQNVNFEIVLVTTDQNKIKQLVKEDKLDILFLDIDFKNGGKNGIDFANDLRELNNKFYLIFLSAHVKYMPLSFVSKTFDFLIKPVHKSVITNLIERLKKDIYLNDMEFIKLNKNLNIKLNSINYIEKSNNKCDIHTANGVFTVIITLDKLLDLLPDNFIKSHRSYIVNTKKISAVDYKTNLITFIDGTTCPHSSHFKFSKEEIKK